MFQHHKNVTKLQAYKHCVRIFVDLVAKRATTETIISNLPRISNLQPLYTA